MGTANFSKFFFFDICGQPKKILSVTPYIPDMYWYLYRALREQVRFWIWELGFKPMTHFLLKYSNGYGECSTDVSNQFLANFLWNRLSKHRIECLKHLPDSHRRHLLRAEKWLTSRCWKLNRGVQHRHLFSTRLSRVKPTTPAGRRMHYKGTEAHPLPSADPRDQRTYKI